MNVSHPLATGVPPQWAHLWGEDRYGVFAGFEVAGVVCRLRWIRPGTFWMGSPDDEPDRLAHEVRREVVVGRGFWLGETTVTQALWRAVMGENRSRFVGDRRPVDRVSWNDVQVFLAKLDDLEPGLGIRLPLEGEWEYGCRAGTETPFSFGETINPEQVNYHGNHPYGRARKGEFRRETVDVKSFRPNEWGLYEMHGNVWEWCEEKPDWLDGGSPRVLRGGSWLNDARRCRSSFRYWSDAGYRADFVGFRVARGQDALQSGGG